jgi:hypothetical protein
VLEELTNAPQYERDAINSGDKETQVAVFKNLVGRARFKVTSDATSTAAEQAAADALAGKQAATVLHGGGTPPPDPAAEA